MDQQDQQDQPDQQVVQVPLVKEAPLEHEDLLELPEPEDPEVNPEMPDQWDHQEAEAEEKDPTPKVLLPLLKRFWERPCPDQMVSCTI